MMFRAILNKIDSKRLYIRHLSSQPNFGFLFDIDGVIIRGKKVIPAAVEGFKLLVESNKKFQIPTVFVTNSGDGVPRDKAAALSEWLGVNVNEKQVVLSHSPMSVLDEYHSKKMLVSGQGNVKEIALALGFTNVITMEELVRNFPSLDYIDRSRRSVVNGPTDRNFEKIEGIVLLNEPINWETSLQLIVDLLMTNGMPTDVLHYGFNPHIPVISCNMDLIWASQAPLPRYGHGAFLLCLESLFKKVTGKELVYTALLGKPSILTYLYANKLILEHARSIDITQPIDTIYAVGDNLNSDIFGANLYNKYLQGHAKSDAPEFILPKISQMDRFTKSQPKACVSTLVETGVHLEHSKINTAHSHRDYESLSENLYKPAIVTADVNSAIEVVLKKEGFK